MNKLTNYLVEQILLGESTVKRTIVVYVGRFQPMHKGHYGVYEHLIKKFGKDNVFIGSSDKVDPPRSPLNFKEKKQIITTMFPIPKNKVVQIKNPYNPQEVLSKFDGNTTAFVTVVSEKDKNRLGGKYFKPYDGNPEFGHQERGYVYVTPMFGKGISASTVRNTLATASDDEQKKFFQTKVYNKFDQNIFDLLKSKLTEGLVIEKEVIEEWLLKEATINGSGQDDDGPNGFFPNLAVFDKVSIARAREIGYEVVKMIMTKDLEDYYEHPEYPNGPVKAVSYYPAGVIGKMTPNNQVDIYSSNAYSQWYTHVNRKASLSGYELVQTQLEKSMAKNIKKLSGDMAIADKDIEAEFENLMTEDINIPVKIGDTILTGKFKNKKTVVKKIGKDEHGMPTINDRKVVTFRMVKKPNMFETHVDLDESEIRCEKCNHEWEIESDDDGKYLCHNCGWDSQKQNFDLEGLDNWKSLNEDKDVFSNFKNLGIKRTDMPQIPKEDLNLYLSYLKENGISYKIIEVLVSNLNLTQKDLSQKVIDKIIKSGKVDDDSRPIIISKDNYILDGHHRTLAFGIIHPNDTIRAIKINLPIKKLLQFTHDFDEVEYKDSVHEVSTITEATEKLKLNIPKGVRDIHKAFKKNGKKLYVVGGAVRDAILGQKPKDFDLATDAKPDEVLKIAEKEGFHTAEVGKQFGVVIVNGDEIATFRKDIGKGRRPDAVDYTDIEGDVKRRDLTINALFYDIERKEIVDLVGGIADLKKRNIKTVGKAEDRFDEDELRKLRAFRFHARIGGKMDKDTESALKNNVSLKGVSPERIRDEFLKSIKSAKSVKNYLNTVDKFGYLKLILPNLIIDKNYQEENDYKVLLSFMLRKNDGLEKKLNKLKYTGEESKDISFLVSLKDFKPEDIRSLKTKQNSQINLTNDQILKFGKMIGKDMKKYVNFKLKLKGSDVPSELQKSEIGKWLNDEEKKRFLNEMSFYDMKSVEKIADKKLAPIDIDFTNHFFDRLNDPRNGKEISKEELINFFDRLSKDKKNLLDFLRRFKDFTLKDKRTNLNIPLATQTNHIIAKTIMRTKNWKSREKIFNIEHAYDNSMENPEDERLYVKMYENGDNFETIYDDIDNMLKKIENK